MYTPEQQVAVLSWMPTASKQGKKRNSVAVSNRVSLGQLRRRLSAW